MTAVAELPALDKTFATEAGITVRRISDSMVMVGDEWGEVPYILPVPESRGRVDGAEAWASRMSQMRASGSKNRHQAVIDFITTVEPDLP